MRLILFDIDGTLLRVAASGRLAVRHAIQHTFGRPLEVDGIPFSGKTDPQILTEILEYHGYAIDRDDERFDCVLRRYTEDMRRRLHRDDVNVLPGARELVTVLAGRDDVHLGLLTGNLEPTAYQKLSVVELDHHFPFGAFGSDHHDRQELPPIALRRAREYSGYRFEGADTIIIGDTPHDVACGQAIGARTVAVCTGRISRKELSQANPDFLLDDLDCHEQFLETVVRANS